jgi:protein-S-isoprenylcysteine O-methyltransferase Ste14
MTPHAALVWNAALCLVFFIQHSAMIRASFRERLNRVLPKPHAAAAYAIVSGLVLLLLMALWQPTGTVLLSIAGGLRWGLRALFLAAGVGVLGAVRALGFFDPFGVEPLRAHLRGTRPRTPPFAVRGPYRWVRHPIYALLLLMTWAHPDVTTDRLLLNALLTGWIVVATVLEERDLVRAFGEVYRSYQRDVPMLVPWRIPGRADRC